MKKFAFTLSEVLLTLSIIGVVSAMTVPSLMTSVQDRELQAQAKKAYNTLQSGISMVYALSRRSPEDIQERYLIGFFISPTYGAKVLNTVENQDGSDWPWVVETGDGMVYLVRTGGSHYCVPNPTSTSNTCYIMVDVNGSDGPNFSAVSYGGGTTTTGVEAQTLTWNSAAFSASNYDKRYRDLVFFAIKGLNVVPYMGSGVTKRYFTGQQ